MPWKVYSYRPGILDPLSYGGFGKKMLAIHCVAQKTKESTYKQIPQQGTYMKAWTAQQCHKDPVKKRKINPIHRLGISLKKKWDRRLPLPIKFFLYKKKLAKMVSHQRQ
ncbi:MAG: hypothetical protein JSS62_02905 [Verrucomicrobia bacterium]|nr:hypothetical protein [Verrucomicrobiota bacterium]MBS0646391.1 hypothetical protein [Verrucomicrobiota bacterium]